MVEPVPRKKVVKEDLNPSENLTSPFTATEELKVAVKIDAPVSPPKAKRYICRVKCWTPKHGVIEQGDIIELGETETIPSHCVLME